jgi:hypothetical protein
VDDDGELTDMEDAEVENLGKEIEGEELTFNVKLRGGLQAYLTRAKSLCLTSKTPKLESA